MRQTIKMLSSMATKQLLAELVANYTAMHPVDEASEEDATIDFASDGGVNAVKRIEAGEALDWIVLGSDALAKLAEGGFIDAASKVDLFESSIAIAVAKGAKPPNIRSEEAVKAAVLHADTIGYSTGPSGVYLIQLFKRWGIADAIAAKLVQAPASVPVGEMVRQGQVMLGFQQLSELQGVEGIEILGLLPPEIQSVTVFSVAIRSGSKSQAAYAKWIEYVTSPSRHEVIVANGMVPFYPG